MCVVFLSRFDAVVLATHSDISLSLLGAGATEEERAVLGAIPYNNNDIYLHTDEALMPVSRSHITSADTQTSYRLCWLGSASILGRPKAFDWSVHSYCMPACQPACTPLSAGCVARHSHAPLLLHTQLLAPAHLLLPVSVTCLFGLRCARVRGPAGTSWETAAPQPTPAVMPQSLSATGSTGCR